MTGLCEGGNEPLSSLKVIVAFVDYLFRIIRMSDIRNIRLDDKSSQPNKIDIFHIYSAFNFLSVNYIRYCCSKVLEFFYLFER
ncbi:hypothetical protein ANN_13167 [Periplaneta americana]|uniref:Uncharacterized protein n=1 Tax=Periplaneta americana TaxID=6978 RepID=A0ABQ8TIN0_PERAM|nr:hypothetical protein ANN_13167 [Periplaneta americana]